MKAIEKLELEIRRLRDEVESLKEEVRKAKACSENHYHYHYPSYQHYWPTWQPTVTFGGIGVSGSQTTITNWPSSHITFTSGEDPPPAASTVLA